MFPEETLEELLILLQDIDSVNIWCIAFFPPWSPSLGADGHGAWVGLINCLAARNLVLNFPLFLQDFHREDL